MSVFAIYRLSYHNLQTGVLVTMGWVDHPTVNLHYTCVHMGCSPVLPNGMFTRVVNAGQVPAPPHPGHESGKSVNCAIASLIAGPDVQPDGELVPRSVMLGRLQHRIGAEQRV